MSGIVLDRYASLDSVVHRLDARAKLIGFVIPVLLIASTPRGEIHPYPYYAGLALTLLVLSRVPAAYILWRCAVASPFILMAAALLLLTGAQDALLSAISVALKAYLCVALMALLTATTRLHDLLRALRSLGSPEALNLIANMMFRYISLLHEEYQRMARARESRTVLPVRKGRFALYARQFALLFIRSWERAERVHDAMLARGFKGTFLKEPSGRLRTADILCPAASCLAFLFCRLSYLMLPPA